MTVPRLPRVYSAIVRGELMATSGYRANLIVSIFGWVVPFVMLALWRGAAADGAIEGITAQQFTTYFAVVLVTTSLSLTQYLIYGFSPLVHDGRLAHYLQRPYHPFHNLVAQGIAEGLFRAGTVAILFGVVIVFIDGSLRTGLEVPTALVLWIIGSIGSGYLAALSGSMALWLTRAYGVQSLVIGAETLLGGLYAPLALLPGWLEAIAQHLPFWFAIGAPAELIAGIIEPGRGAIAIVEGLVWIVVLHGLFRVVWRRGMQQYELVGG